MRKFWHSMLLWRLVIILECAVLLFGILITIGHLYSSYITIRATTQNDLLLEINSSVNRKSYYYLQAQRRLQTLASLWDSMSDDESLRVNPRHVTFVSFPRRRPFAPTDNTDIRLAESLVELFGNTSQNNCEAPYVILPKAGGIFYQRNDPTRSEADACLKDRVRTLPALDATLPPGLHWDRAVPGSDGKLSVPLLLASRENDALFGLNAQVWQEPKLVKNQLWKHISFAMLDKNTLQMLPLATVEKSIALDELPDSAFFASCNEKSIRQINGYYFVCKAFQGPPWLMVARYPVSMITTQALRNQAWQLLFTLIMLLILSLIIYWVLRRQMGRPLQRLVESVRCFSALDETTRLTKNRRDELGYIARAYNQLATMLKTSYQLLETQVNERTQLLDEARRNAELVSTRKSEHIATISHELRTPMNGVVGAMELLERTTLTPPQSELVDMARSSLEYMLAIINNLIDYRQIETGQLKLTYEQGELLPLLDSVLLTIYLNAQKKGIALSVLVMADVPLRLSLNRLRLEQILINLLGNAVKFTHHGSVTVQVSRRGTSLAIEVQDTGPGIAEDKQQEIFVPFVQVNAYSGGNGLGLTIARMLASLMGGDITLYSQPGSGATFTLLLPLHNPEGTLRLFSGTVNAPARLHRQLQEWGITPEAGKNQRLSSPGLAYLPGRLQQHLLKIFYRQALPKYDYMSVPSFCPWSLKVLIVDDVATNLKIMSRLLQNLGHQTELAASGYQALHMGRHAIYDMVLMDLRMPEMDGYETTRRWRDADGGMLDSETPVIALTADIVTLTSQKIEGHQMQGFLIKPLQMKKLHLIIEQVIALQLARGMELQPNEWLQKPLMDVDDDILQAQLKTTFATLETQITYAWQRGQKEELAEKLHTLKGCTGLGGVKRIYRLTERLANHLSEGYWPQELEMARLRQKLIHWPELPGEPWPVTVTPAKGLRNAP